MHSAHTSCEHGGSYLDVGRNLGNLKSVAISEVFSGILIQISEDVKGCVPPSILRNVDYILMYLLRACQTLRHFDDWDFKDCCRLGISGITLGRWRQLSSRSIVSLDYGNFQDMISGILESLELRLHDDDRPCLRVLYIYVELVRVYASKVQAEISASLESLQSIGTGMGEKSE
jgi:hypothetical protein